MHNTVYPANVSHFPPAINIFCRQPLRLLSAPYPEFWVTEKTAMLIPELCSGLWASLAAPLPDRCF
jgi:hypothetical protein